MKAIILNLTAWSVLPIMDGMAKYLSSDMHVFQVVWGRYFFMTLISLPLTYIFFKQSFVKPKIFLFNFCEVFFYFFQQFSFFMQFR